VYVRKERKNIKGVEPDLLTLAKTFDINSTVRTAITRRLYWRRASIQDGQVSTSACDATVL